jgi:DNA-repair protein XRCC1
MCLNFCIYIWVGVNPAKEAKVTKLGAFFLKDEPKETDLGYKAPIGSLFAAKRHTTVASESKPMSIAASLRSEATLAEIACEANKHKRKNSDKFPSPDISLVLKTEEQKKESHKKRKVGTSLERKEVIKPCLNLSLALNKESKLPRRDILPGERPLTPLPPNVPGKIDTSLERRTVTKPFPRLMEGVKFVISGYQNPRRSELRQKALDMGAKYNADWDNSCTHLVCAYINTPKFNQVRKQSTKAKIVKCDWIESSYKNKIRYPWRRFCLDPKDSGTRADESEDEISEEKIYESKPLKESLSKVDDHHNSIVDDNQYDKNTDDEIEELLKEGKNDGKNHKPVLNDKIIASTIKNVEEDCDSAYNQETDEEEPEREMNGYHNTNEIKEDSDDAYNADTDVDAEEVHRNDTLNSPIPPKLEKRILSIELDENCSDIVNNALPELQTHFCGLNFFLYGVYSDDEKYVVKKCILSSGGSVEKVIGPNVNYVVCVDASREWDRNLDLALKEAPEVKFVRSQFITDCCKKGHLLKAPDYYI